MKKFIYKTANKQVKAQSVTSLTTYPVVNSFPQFSITLYEDPNLEYKRQMLDTRQILSTIASDDYFPYDLVVGEKDNYLHGKSSPSRTFYLKVKTYSLDDSAPGQNSNYFVLAKTLNDETKYYPIQVVYILNNAVIYTGLFSLLNSDYKEQFDGNMYLNIVGSYDVKMQYPISIVTTNSSVTNLTTNINTSKQNLGITSNFSQYFSVINNTGLIGSYAYDQNFSFTPFTIALAQSLFSSISTIISTSSNFAAVRMDFSSGKNFHNLQYSYFGATISNSQVGFSTINVYSNLKIKTQSGITVVEPIILNNFSTSCYNLIYKFKDVFSSSDEVEYMLMELNINDVAITRATDITFLSLIKPQAGFTAFMAEAVESSDTSHNYTLDAFSNKITFNNLYNKMPLLASDGLTTLESLISMKAEVSYKISTQSHTATLSEDMLIKTSDDFVPVYALSKDSFIETTSGVEKITYLVISPDKDIEILDFYENQDYVMNGFYVKNPFFITDFKRKFLPSLQKTDDKSTHTISINGEVFLFKEQGGVLICEMNLILKGKANNEFKFISEIENLLIFYSCDDSAFIKYERKRDKIESKTMFMVNRIQNYDSFILKSNSNIVLKKMIAK